MRGGEGVKGRGGQPLARWLGKMPTFPQGAPRQLQQAARPEGCPASAWAPRAWLRF